MEALYFRARLLFGLFEGNMCSCAVFFPCDRRENAAV